MAEVRDMPFFGCMPDEVFNSAGFDGCYHDLVLAAEKQSNRFFGSALVDLFTIGSPLFGDNRTAHIYQRFEEGMLLPAVLSLNVIYAASMLNISIEAGDHPSRK